MTSIPVFEIAQIVFADVILSGDNALVIGMAAAGLSPELRASAIFWGMGWLLCCVSYLQQWQAI